MTRLDNESPSNDEALGTFDQRWRAWQQRGRARAVRSHRRLKIGLAVVVGGGLLVWLVRLA